MCVQWAGNNLPQGDFDKGDHKNSTIARVCIFYGTVNKQTVVKLFECFTVIRDSNIEAVTDDNYNEV